MEWHSLLLLMLVTVQVGVVVGGTGHDLAGTEGHDEGKNCKLHCDMERGYREERGREDSLWGNR